MTESADRTFAIFGGVVVLLAVLLIAAHEDVEAGAARANWQVSFPETTHTESEDGNLQEGDSDVYDYDWQIMNLTTLEFILTWNDNDGVTTNDDSFTLEYSGPDGQSGQTQGTSGELTLTQLISEPPATFRVDKATRAKAQEAADGFASTVGMGNWSVTVTLDNANPAFLDTSEGYELAINVRSFAANLAELTGNEV